MPVAGEEELAVLNFLLVRTSITERRREQKHRSFTEAESPTILQTPFSNNASLAKHKIAQPRTAKKNTRKDTHKTHDKESKENVLNSFSTRPTSNNPPQNHR
jgi:hypothetical protein